MNDVFAAHPDLYLEHCAVMAIALLAPASQASCRFRVQCKNISAPDLEPNCAIDLDIRWTTELLSKSRRVRRTEQRKPMIERAAIAIAALLFSHFVPDSQIRVTRQGERADYWLPQIQCALEVSGTENASEVARRHRMKTKQVLENSGLEWVRRNLLLR